VVEEAAVEEASAETGANKEAVEEEADNLMEEAEAEEEIASESMAAMVMLRTNITPLKNTSGTLTKNPSSSIFVLLARTNKMQDQEPHCAHRQLPLRSKHLRPNVSPKAGTRMTKMLATLTALTRPSRGPSNPVMVHSDSRC
jgi:hypothetical protein